MAKHEVRTKRGTTPGGRAYASTQWESGGRKGQYTEVFEKNLKTGGQKNTFAKSVSASNLSPTGSEPVKAKISPKGKRATVVTKGPTKPVAPRKKK